MHRAEADLFSLTRELEQANAELLASSERERHTAQSLAGLATTVSALSAAESRSELLRQMFRHGRRALQADVLAVALLEPGGGHLAVVDTRDDRRFGAGQAAVGPLAGAHGGSGRRPAGLPGGRGRAAPPAPLEGLEAWAALPLRIGGRPLGSLTVGWERRHVFEDNDVRVLEAFAAQCSQAVNRVARRETERRQARASRSLAETLQRSLLTDPPQPEHLDIAVRYRPAAREAQVGGDWYDAFVSPTGDTTLVVGDVTGHDWTAAAIAGQLRSMLRGVASPLGHRAPHGARRPGPGPRRVGDPDARHRHRRPRRGAARPRRRPGAALVQRRAPTPAADRRRRRGDRCWSGRRTCSWAWTRTGTGITTPSPAVGPGTPSSCSPTG